MERRLLIVFALTFLVILIFQPLLKKFGSSASGETGESAGDANRGQAFLRAELRTTTQRKLHSATVAAAGQRQYRLRSRLRASRRR
jgi:hypothetical protein